MSAAKPTRVAQVVRLRAERRDTYLDLHRRVPPEVLATIDDCNISNYSIFEIDGLLLAYFEYTGDDRDADSARMRADPATRRWWELTDPCQEPLAGQHGPRPWADMTEIFHRD